MYWCRVSSFGIMHIQWYVLRSIQWQTVSNWIGRKYSGEKGRTRTRTKLITKKRNDEFLDVYGGLQKEAFPSFRNICFFEKHSRTHTYTHIHVHILFHSECNNNHTFSIRMYVAINHFTLNYLWRLRINLFNPQAFARIWRTHTHIHTLEMIFMCESKMKSESIKLCLF